MSESSNSGRIGFGGLLAIAFIILKLVGVIEWSWLWVLAPIWIGLIIWLFCIAILIIAAVITKN